MTIRLSEWRRAVSDVAPLLQFRLADLRGRRRRAAASAIGFFVVLTVAAAAAPAFGPGATTSSKAGDLLILLPTAYLAFLLTTTLAIVGTGGGRELMAADQAVAFPVSPTTDHLGALLLAPLNIAWVLQAWSLLAVTAYVAGTHHLLFVQLMTLSWLAAATAVAQALAWCVEWVRRGPHGIAVVRSTYAVLGLGGAALVATNRLGAVFDASPTVWVVIATLAPLDQHWLTWCLGIAATLSAGALAVALGAGAAHAVSRRTSRDEARAEARAFAPRAMPRSELAALVRTDRASVWRSVPLRRGLIFLAMLPGMVAAAGALPWEMLPILPGLVAAGGALLFGINAWCLDGVGALWRDSEPVDPQLAFVARVWVLLEVLLVATLLMLLVAGVRARGLPNSAEATALGVTVAVVSLQVVARSMQWSVRHPYAVELRSARGTPAPPFVMLGYSAWLALTSTLTGVMFGVTAQASDPTWALILALPLLLAAVRRLVITARDWADPDIRARVVSTVAAR